MKNAKKLRFFFLPDSLDNVIGIGMDFLGDVETLLYVGLLVVDHLLHGDGDLYKGSLQLPIEVVDVFLDRLDVLYDLVDPRPESFNLFAEL